MDPHILFETTCRVCGNELDICSCTTRTNGVEVVEVRSGNLAGRRGVVRRLVDQGHNVEIEEV